ncbi:hypothetical protein [Maribacter sp. IgM3_T14_3]|uniref:hypothetical protein n=1 Tax=Maribacter sp. IgM3_T14_3 TaxID=3415140 RepID=UPI003C700A51
MEKFLILTMFALGILTFGQESSTEIMNHNNKNLEFLEVYQPKEITKSTETTNYSGSETFTTDENQDTMYCLLRDRNEF